MTGKPTARTLLRVLVSVTVALALTHSLARAEISRRDREALSKADLVYAATVRKNATQSQSGARMVHDRDNNSILIQTEKTTWKAKRIRRGSPGLVWIGTADGPAQAIAQSRS